MACAEIFLLRELLSTENDRKVRDDLVNKTIRITGSLRLLNPTHRFCHIGSHSSSGPFLFVDLRIADYSKLLNSCDVETNLEGMLCQVMGTIRRIESHPKPSIFENERCYDNVYMEATIIRCVDGLDMELFERALLKRREFLLSQGKKT